MGQNIELKTTYGFCVSGSNIRKLFIRETEGIFHFEDRFDQKTGKKLEPVKIYDEKPKQHLYFNNEKFEFSSYEKYHKKYDKTFSMENIILLLWLIANESEEERKLSTFSVDCDTEQYRIIDTIDHVKFYFHISYEKDDSYNYWGSNSFDGTYLTWEGNYSLKFLKENEGLILKLKSNLEKYGIFVGDPSIFIRKKEEFYYDR